MATVNLSVWIPTVIGVLTIGGMIVRFFQLITKLEMKLKEVESRHEKDMCDTKGDIDALGKKVSEQAHYQIQTEKDIVEINGRLKNIEGLLEEIKADLRGR